MEPGPSKEPLDPNRKNSEENAKKDREVNVDLNQPCFRSDGKPDQEVAGFDIVAFAESMSEKMSATDQSLAPAVNMALVTLYATGQLHGKLRWAVEYLEVRYKDW